MTRASTPEDLRSLARAVAKEITFQRMDGYAFSAADMFGLLNRAMATSSNATRCPRGQGRTLDGPVAHLRIPHRRFSIRRASVGRAFARAVKDTSAFCQSTGRVPDEVWIGSESLSPADYLATLAQAFDDAMTSRQAPAEVVRRTGHFTADRYVAEDSPALWGWAIFPEASMRRESWSWRACRLGR